MPALRPRLDASRSGGAARAGSSEGGPRTGGGLELEGELEQAALLAGLIRSPATYDPIANPDAALQRRNLVLSRMRELGWASEAEVAAANRENPEAAAARGLWGVYFLFAGACLLAYRWAGMGWADAFMHMCTTMGLGGFSSHDASFAY